MPICVGRTLSAVLLLALVLVTPASAEPLDAVLEPYFRIQSMLADDSVEGVAKDAAMVADAAGRLGAAAGPVSAAARDLSTVTTIAAARKAFGALSAALIGYAEKTKTPLGADVHTVHCPMARATWLQKGEQVRNPHYGKSMLTCGEIVKRPGA